MSTLQENLASANAAIRFVKDRGIQSANKRTDRVAAEGGIESTTQLLRTTIGTPNTPPPTPTVPVTATVAKKTEHFEALFAPTPPPLPPLKKNEVGATSLMSSKISVKVDKVRQNSALSTNSTLADITKMAKLSYANQAGNCMEQACIAITYMLTIALAKPGAVDLMRFTKKGYDHMWVIVGRADGSAEHNPRDWGSRAVWCDPWQRAEAFSIADFVAGKLINLNAIYGCDTADTVAIGVPQSIYRYGSEVR